MGFKIEMKENNQDSMDIFFKALEKSCEDVENKIFEKMKKEIPNVVVGELRKIKRHGKISAKRLKHMCDDVQGSVKTDTFGYKVFRVSGGKKTGTLWHIVNNGTYRSKATHFMDKSMGAIDSISERIIDEVISKEMKDD